MVCTCAEEVLRVVVDLEVSGKRKRGRRKTWKKLVEEETEKIGLKDAMNRAKWRRMGSNCKRNGVNPAISRKGNNIG